MMKYKKVYKYYEEPSKLEKWTKMSNLTLKLNYFAYTYVLC